MELAGKILLTIFYLGAACWLTHLTWDRQIDFPKTVKNLAHKAIAPIYNFISDPLDGSIVTRDSNKLYDQQGDPVGVIAGKVLPLENGQFLFSRIIDAGTAITQNFEVEWERKKLKLVSVEQFSGFELPSQDKNVLTNAVFKEATIDK